METNWKLVRLGAILLMSLAFYMVACGPSKYELEMKEIQLQHEAELAAKEEVKSISVDTSYIKFVDMKETSTVRIHVVALKGDTFLIVTDPNGNTQTIKK